MEKPPFGAAFSLERNDPETHPINSVSKIFEYGCFCASKTPVGDRGFQARLKASESLLGSDYGKAAQWAARMGSPLHSNLIGAIIRFRRHDHPR